MRVTCGDIEVAWHEVGRGAPLVLIHGLADDHRSWRRMLPELALERSLLLYDLRGHGETSFGEADSTLAQLGADLVALLDRVELDRASLAGFSLGGTIAMRVAIDHPARVDRLFPIATSSRVGRAAAAWYRERATLVEERSPGLPATVEADTRAMFVHAPAQFVDAWRIRAESTADPRGYGNACRAMAALQEAPLDPELGGITAPTLVVSSDLDPNCPPRAGQIIADGIAGARMEILLGAGHQIPVEKPAELARLILEF